ncbi:MAG: BtpA/SgcQ family protein [Pirellulaceae bacterium]
MSVFFRRTSRPQVVGMIHVAALPGAPGYRSDFEAVMASAIADAISLENGGADAVMVENFFDTPFPSGDSAAVTISHLTAIAIAVSREIKIPMGINLLRNDAIGALAVAQASAAQFIRVNVLAGTRVTDQGLINGDAYRVMRERSRCGAHHIGIAADVDVKHSAPLTKRPIEEEATELAGRGGADAIIVSGSATGRSTSHQDLRQVRNACPDSFLMVGSGVDVQNASQLAEHCDAMIVGSSLKTEGQITAPVDVERVRRLMNCLV